jgi:SAM-dependent methyltransferase
MPLTLQGEMLVCGGQHRYPIVDGVPVMLMAEAPETIGIAAASITAATTPDPSGLYVSTLSLSDEERQGILDFQKSGSAIDPVVAYLVAATNGMMYRHLIGALDRYPIPELPMRRGDGQRLLDIGCSWGRWTLAAARRGYEAVGIDPSLGAVLAAKRSAAALGQPARFVVGDARHLPFTDGMFDAAYSYSVIQHLSFSDASRAVHEIGRVVKPSGVVRVQMPTRYGLRCLYHQARRKFRTATGFEVRYWTWSQLRALFTEAIGATRFEVDGYFGIGLQPADRALMTPTLRAVLGASEWLKVATKVAPVLKRGADSVFVDAVRSSRS